MSSKVCLLCLKIDLNPNFVFLSYCLASGTPADRTLSLQFYTSLGPKGVPINFLPNQIMSVSKKLPIYTKFLLPAIAFAASSFLSMPLFPRISPSSPNSRCTSTSMHSRSCLHWQQQACQGRVHNWHRREVWWAKGEIMSIIEKATTSVVEMHHYSFQNLRNRYHHGAAFLQLLITVTETRQGHLLGQVEFATQMLTRYFPIPQVYTSWSPLSFVLICVQLLAIHEPTSHPNPAYSGTTVTTMHPIPVHSLWGSSCALGSPHMLIG